MDLHAHLARSIVSGLSGDVGSVVLGACRTTGPTRPRTAGRSSTRSGT